MRGGKVLEWKWMCTLLLAVLPLCMPAQVKVTATVEAKEKSILIGHPFEVSMIIMHPDTVPVIFPDSSKQVAPFEIHASEARPTQTDDAGISTDQKVYHLYAWELDSLQTLRMPFWYVTGGDTLTDSTNQQVLTLDPFVENYSDTLRLKYNNQIAEIQEPIRLSTFLILFLGSLAILLVLFLTLWSPVVKAYKRWRINRSWRRVNAQYHAAGRLIQADSARYLGDIRRVWRPYMDPGGEHAFPALTTQELAEGLKKLSHLTDADRDTLMLLSGTIDRHYYAGIPADPKQLQDIHTRLGDILFKEFQRRKEHLIV